jgi:hypothetical protein
MCVLLFLSSRRSSAEARWRTGRLRSRCDGAVLGARLEERRLGFGRKRERVDGYHSYASSLPLHPLFALLTHRRSSLLLDYVLKLHMIPRKPFGHGTVLNISSITAHQAPLKEGFETSYHTSKVRS